VKVVQFLLEACPTFVALSLRQTLGRNKPTADSDGWKSLMWSRKSSNRKGQGSETSTAVRHAQLMRLSRYMWLYDVGRSGSFGRACDCQMVYEFHKWTRKGKTYWLKVS